MWFRSDLRITDNPALFCASETGAPIVAIFFICEQQWQQHALGTAKVDFILRQLGELKQSLSIKNIPLLVRVADTFSNIPNMLAELCASYGIKKIWCNKEYEVNEIVRDAACQRRLANVGVELESLHEQCILAPATVTTQEGGMYKVFTPFFRRWQAHLNTSGIECVPAPAAQEPLNIQADTIPKLKHYDTSTLPSGITGEFPAGESVAMQRLQDFINAGLDSYEANRNTPALDGTSGLSPYLALGAISARQCYVAAHNRQSDGRLTEGGRASAKTWISELAWRDFYRHIMVAYPRVVKGAAYNQDTDTAVNWRYDESDFATWRTGKTGVPLIDAAMRALNATGFMHNRLRMVVAMFLTKNLLIDWRLGERYFLQTLIDADFASNNGGWQWSASVGTDAAPYFRIMNPYSQGKTHDPNAAFIKYWLPELNNLTPAVIHDESKLGKIAKSVGYVPPMVDTKATRKAAIEAFKTAN